MHLAKRNDKACLLRMASAQLALREMKPNALEKRTWAHKMNFGNDP
jgi:hypothetical protein